MDKNRSFNFESFVTANKGKVVSGFDYVHIIYKSSCLSGDFILRFAKIIYPEFQMFGGKIYLSELFDHDYYQELLKSGRNISEVQFWLNLLEVTGLFDDLSNDQAIEFAGLLVKSWNAKLRAEFPETLDHARIVENKEIGEIFVTIGD